MRDHTADLRWTAVRTAQLDAAALGAQGVAATIDLTLSDPIHLDSMSQRRLGRRFARLGAGRVSTITLDEVTCAGARADWPTVFETMTVRLRFRGVTGGLQPRTHVPGFSVRDPAGHNVASVWRVEVATDAPDTVVVHLAGPPGDGDALWYGWGTAPHCTLVDDADMAVPAFGPVPLPS